VKRLGVFIDVGSIAFERAVRTQPFAHPPGFARAAQIISLFINEAIGADFGRSLLIALARYWTLGGSGQLPIRNRLMNTRRTALLPLQSLALRTKFATFWLGLSLSMATLFTPLPAHAVVGGTPSAVPWAVQLVNLDNHQVSQVCVGAAINEHTVITTTHCSVKAVSFADRTVTVESRHDIKGTEITVLFLTSPYALTEYAKTGPKYISNGKVIPAGTSGTAYGYGPAYFLPQQSVGVKVKGHGPSTKTPEVLSMYSIGAGALQEGDSGAPLVIDGHFVGVLQGNSAGKPPPGSDALYTFIGLSPALDSINALLYQRRARQFIASEEL
jgi:hypothetical protein